MTRRRLAELAEVLGPFLALLLVYALFAALADDSFTTWRNAVVILRQTAIVGTASVGMTLVVMSGGIDLSVGSVVALSCVVVAWLLERGVPAVPAALAGVACGAGCGLVNGVLVTRLKVVPFIVTLGTLLLVRGAALGLANEQKIDTPASWLPELLATLPPERRWMLVPPGVWLLLVVAAASALLLQRTATGRHVVATGANEATARLCGVPVDRLRVGVYALGGAAAGLAGVLQFARLTVGDPTVAQGLELDVIAAVVIGGGSLAGGVGSVRGSLVGALIMSVISTGCSMMSLPNWVQQIVTGVIIVLAVALDGVRHRRAT